MSSTKKPGAGPSSKLSRRQILEAAHRHFVLGETQTAIAADLEISSGYMAKLLQHAREQGWVRVHVDVDAEIDLANRFRLRFPHLLHCQVVPTLTAREEAARALGTAMATWVDDLLDEDAQREPPRIWNVAIGGGMLQQAMLDPLVTRPNRLSVGPTALTPEGGRVARFTAPTLSAMLAMKWGALLPGHRQEPERRRKGFRYNLTVDPPRGSLSALRDWYAQLQERPGYREMLRFWENCDLVFVGIVGIDSAYHDVRQRLAELGLSVDAMKERGAIALVANQFVDVEGNLVPLAEGVPSYEPAIPVSLLRGGVDANSGRRRIVVVEAWGAPAIGALPVFDAGLGTVVFADSVAAEQAIRR